MLAMDVVSTAKRARRCWTLEEKLAIVAAAKTSGDPVSVVARRYGMNANHLFNWLQRDRDGTLDRRAMYVEAGGPLDFVSLGVVGEAREVSAPTAADRAEIELVDGTKVRVSLAADPEGLRRLLAAVTSLPKPRA